MEKNIHNRFEDAIEELGFKRDPMDRLNYFKIGSYGWKYNLKFEGYAYVLYQEYRVYPWFLESFLWIRNRFVKHKEVALTYELPLTHFHDPERLTDILGNTKR
jgi:hypothetical protein